MGCPDRLPRRRAGPRRAPVGRVSGTRARPLAHRGQAADHGNCARAGQALQARSSGAQELARGGARLDRSGRSATTAAAPPGARGGLGCRRRAARVPRGRALRLQVRRVFARGRSPPDSGTSPSCPRPARRTRIARDARWRSRSQPASSRRAISRTRRPTSRLRSGWPSRRARWPRSAAWRSRCSSPRSSRSAAWEEC